MRAAWEKRLTCSMLQLDLKGAFDRVHHGWLVTTLEDQGWPRWVVRWVASFLADRTATLTFDDWEAEPLKVPAGVPQGSPLSPLLFILFSTPLFQRLRDIEGVGTVGFADDTNLLAVGKRTEDCCSALLRGWEICRDWARERGMIFEPQKSQLMHFVKTRAGNNQTLTLNDNVIKPAEETRFLGVYLDRRLNFIAHKNQILAKLKTQRFALTRIAAKTWGPSLLKARDVYVSVIRSVLTYAASTFATIENTLGGKQGRGSGIVLQLDKEQNKCLRVVTGAYRSTPVNVLEAEAHCKPINLILAERAAAFEARATGEGGVWPETWDRITRLIARAKRGGRGRERGVHLLDPMRQWASWTAGTTAKKKTEERWRDLQLREGVHQRKPRVGVRWNTARKIWEQLTKHESSCLVQARSGHIGLRQYLRRMQVPDVEPWCACRGGRAVQETAAHIILDCELEDDRTNLPPLRGRGDLNKALEDPKRCPRIIKWLLATGRLREYRLALQLQQTVEHGRL